MRDGIVGFLVIWSMAASLSVDAGIRAAESPNLAGVPKYVIEHWENEFAALESELEVKRKHYERDQDPYEGDRLLDRHSCILPEDRTPFDVESRRTKALIDLLREQHEVGFLSSARNRLALLRKEVKNRVALSGTATRAEALSDYFAVAALRRRVAMSNPLLDFDSLLFVGRGPTLRSSP